MGKGKSTEHVEFEYDENNNMTKMTVIHDNDHGNSKHHEVPHAHDIPSSTPTDDLNSGWGKGRSLTDDEKEKYDSWKNDDRSF